MSQLLLHHVLTPSFQLDCLDRHIYQLLINVCALAVQAADLQKQAGSASSSSSSTSSSAHQKTSHQQFSVSSSAPARVRDPLEEAEAMIAQQSRVQNDSVVADDIAAGLERKSADAIRAEVNSFLKLSFSELDRQNAVKSPLAWWATKSSAFPVLARAAELVFTHVISAVEPERGFSALTALSTPDRARLSPNAVNDCVFLSRNSRLLPAGLVSAQMVEPEPSPNPAAAASSSSSQQSSLKRKANEPVDLTK